MARDVKHNASGQARARGIKTLIFHVICCAFASVSEILYTHRLTIPDRDEVQLEILDSANNVSPTSNVNVGLNVK